MQGERAATKSEVVSHQLSVVSHHDREERMRLPSWLATDRRLHLPAFATAAAAIAAVSAIAESDAATTASSALSLGTGFVHVDGASADLGAVQCCDGFLAVLIAGHFDEAETAGAAGVAVGHDTDAIDLTVTFENLPEFVFVGVE